MDLATQLRCDCLWRGGRGARPTAEGAEQEESSYQIRVEGFQQVQGPSTLRRGHRVREQHIVYMLTVSNGNARWPLRRRFRQVVLLHQQLLQGLGRSAMAQGLPQLPPKVTPRSLICGHLDDGFVAARAARMETYFRELLRFIPHVDFCEALNEFLNSVETENMDYDALLDLGEALGQCGEHPGAEPAAIEELPQRSQRAEGGSDDSPSHCVICQEVMLPGEDVRVLPCAHEYHFHCIAQWAAQKNSCCVCQGVAVMSPAACSSEADK